MTICDYTEITFAAVEKKVEQRSVEQMQSGRYFVVISLAEAETN